MSRFPLHPVAATVMLAALSLAHAQSASAPDAAAAPASTTEAQAPAAATADVTEGKVAYYGRKFAGRRTASGQRFDPDALTMAHNTLPFGTEVRVTNLANQKSVTVRVNDRGPTTPGRIGDLSLAAARKIGMVRAGVVEARLEVISMGKGR